jgi:hypothetical protein
MAIIVSSEKRHAPRFPRQDVGVGRPDEGTPGNDFVVSV